MRFLDCRDAAAPFQARRSNCNNNAFSTAYIAAMRLGL
jgi:hypothetical protein